MNILSIDSSAKAASAAVVSDGVLVSEFFVNNGLTHSQTLMPMVKSVLDMARMSVSQLDAFALTNGPGSFTGIRIGAAAVKGMAVNKPCIGVSTLLATAYNLYGCYEGVVCAAMDARCSQVYTALFDIFGNKVTRITEDMAIPVDELKKIAINLKKVPIFVGDGAKICYNAFQDSCVECLIAPEHLLYQRASGVAFAALESTQECRAVSPSELNVNYLRLSQAERERNKAKAD